MEVDFCHSHEIGLAVDMDAESLQQALALQEHTEAAFVPEAAFVLEVESVPEAAFVPEVAFVLCTALASLVGESLARAVQQAFGHVEPVLVAWAQLDLVSVVLEEA